MESILIKNLREALVQSPENASLRKLLAQALLENGQFLESEIEFKEALQLSKGDLDIKLGLAQAFFYNEKYTQAELVAEEMLAANFKLPQVNMLLSRIALQRKDPKSAYEFFNTAIDLDSQMYDPALEDDITDAIHESGTAIANDFDFDGSEGFDGLFDALEKPKVKFEDVGGMMKVKEEISLKIIQPLKNPEIYKAFGKKAGGGVMLYGPPGCGKTLLARATAGEINAAFINVGISDVLDMWLGNSEKNLHEIFQQARASQPCVLFFDEVDALGANRSDLRQTSSRFIINQFLDELDGVKYSNEGILILAATNTPWFLDTAFRRPGRFDRIIFVAPPDAEAREEIFKIHLAAVPTEGVKIPELVKLTEDYSGADLKAVIDIAIEAKLPESMRQGKVIPVSHTDMKNAITRHRPSTKEWFATAKNHALYANESGLYDDVLRYLKIKK
jgi:transitional endoplasmic reticulum ATPase